jgi:hypothetical protein
LLFLVPQDNHCVWRHFSQTDTGFILKVSLLEIENFRGVKKASLLLPDHAVLIGDNNTGKSTVLEALDLVLGPDRLSRQSPIDEHDFYQGMYSVPEEDSGKKDVDSADGPRITITAIITGLSEEQLSYFGSYIEWWDATKNELFDEADAEKLDASPPSCPRLSRASTPWRESKAWMAGTNPAMTNEGFWRNEPERSSSGGLAKRTRDLEQFQWLSARLPSGLTSPRT